MKSAHYLVSFFLITALNSSCALGMGQRRECEPPVIPIRPVDMFCISNASGVGQCYNPITQKNEIHSMENYVCRDISTDNRQQEWIDSVLNVVKP